MSVAVAAVALIYALILWWGSTGAILWLDRRSRGSFRWSLAAASGVAAVATGGLIWSRTDATPWGAVIAFTSALALWGWHELSFLTGFITGPSADPCPPDARGWRRFRLAVATLIHHELALAITAAVVAGVSLGQPNAIGGWTFLVLFAARLSAKLNLFFGAPSFSAELFPSHLRYLTTYLRKGPVSALFPLSISILLAAAALSAWRGLDPANSVFEITGFALIFTLTALALLEHAFMAVPIPDAALWRWALPQSERSTHPAEPVGPASLKTPS